MQGLSNSWVVVPILSNDCIESMQASFARETPDNVLLEWMGTLGEWWPGFYFSERPSAH